MIDRKVLRKRLFSAGASHSTEIIDKNAKNIKGIAQGAVNQY
jgi:hypothetical protein